MQRWYYVSERLGLPLRTVNSWMKAFHGKNENEGENNWLVLDVDWGSPRGAMCLKGCVAQSPVQGSHAAFRESGHGNRSWICWVLVPVYLPSYFFLSNYLGFAWTSYSSMFFSHCMALLWDEKCLLHSACWIAFCSPSSRPGLSLIASEGWLCFADPFRILQKECQCRNVSMHRQISNYQINGNCSGGKKKKKVSNIVLC